MANDLRWQVASLTVGGRDMIRRVVLLCGLTAAGWLTRGLCAADSQSLRVDVRIGPRHTRGTTAASTQPRRIVVNGDTMRVRDLFPTATGQLSEAELGRAVITGLRPGERRTLTGREIALHLSEVGIDPSKRALPISGSVVVERAAHVVPASTIVGADGEAIRGQWAPRPGDEATIAPVTEARPMLAPVGMLRVEATARRPALRGRLWVADVTGWVGEEAAFTCTLRYRVPVAGDVLVTRRVRRHGTLGPCLGSLRPVLPSLGLGHGATAWEGQWATLQVWVEPGCGCQPPLASLREAVCSCRVPP
jgi:hypothetical protein